MKCRTVNRKSVFAAQFFHFFLEKTELFQYQLTGLVGAGMEKTSVYSGIPWNVNPRLSADNAAIFGVQKNLQARYWWYYLPASKCSSRVLIFSHETIYLFTYLGTFFPEIEKASRDAKTTFLSVLHFDLVLFAHFVLFLSGCGFFDNFDISLKGPRLFSYFFTFQFWTQSRVFAQFDCFCSEKQ